MSTNTQITLTGDRTDARRERPGTMLRCEECGELVLRSDRYDHPHELSEENTESVIDHVDDLSEDCNVSTATYEVEFTYEYREVVYVEASHKSEAKWKAEEEATLRGEYVDTLHTRTSERGDESIATIEYLETHGLLPEGHDVTTTDLERLADQAEGDT